MPAGLQVLNNSGILQITENYKNYLFDRKVTLTGSLENNWPKYSYIFYVTVDNDSVVAFIPAPGKFVGLHSTTIGATGTTYEFFSPIIGTGAPTATFYIFSVNKTPPNVPYGLEVYGEDSKLVFSSNSLYMKPITAWSGTDYTQGMVPVVSEGGYLISAKVIYPSVGTNKAVLVASPSGGWSRLSYRDGDNQYYWDEDVRGMTYGVMGNNLYISDSLLGGRGGGPTGTPPGDASYSFPQYYGMLIDVTGL